MDKYLRTQASIYRVFFESLLNADRVSIEGINRYLIEAPTRLLYTFLGIMSSPSGNKRPLLPSTLYKVIYAFEDLHIRKYML